MNSPSYSAASSRTLQKALMLLVAAILITVVGVGGIFAWLHVSTDSVVNTFEAGSVTCEIQESFSGSVKSDVCVKNTGDVDAFVRAAVTVTWVDSDGIACAQLPRVGVDYTMSMGDSGWSQGSDGLWYCSGRVAPGEVTSALIDEARPISAGPEGCTLCVDVLAEAVQADGGADGVSAAEAAWGAEAAQLVVGSAGGE